MTALAAAFLFQVGQGILVETESPDAHCPDLHQTREAVNARLGTIQGRGYRARYTIVHARGEIPKDFVLLEVSSPDGEVHLRRELPIGDSCAAVADAIALVLDQYFRALAPEETQPEPADPPSVYQTDPPRERRRDSAEPSRPSWLAMLEFAAVSFPSSVAAGLRLQAELSSSWHTGLELSMPLGDRVEALPGVGEARARSFELSAHLGWGPELGAVRPYLGPTVFTMLERGYSTSPLTTAAQYRLLGGAGGELGLNVRLGNRWRTVIFASGGRVFAQSGTFVVEGDEVLRGFGWVGKVGLGLAYVF
jgi:hypothetical protein